MKTQPSPTLAELDSRQRKIEDRSLESTDAAALIAEYNENESLLPTIRHDEQLRSAQEHEAEAEHLLESALRAEPEIEKSARKLEQIRADERLAAEDLRTKVEAKNDLIKSKDDLQREAVTCRNAAHNSLLTPPRLASAIIYLQIPALIRNLRPVGRGNIRYGGLEFENDSSSTINRLIAIASQSNEADLVVKAEIRKLREGTYHGVIVTRL